MTPEEKSQMQMDHLEALADAWAEEVDLTSMITNATHPMTLTPRAPDGVKRKFHERMKAHIFDLVQQSFIEGAVRGIDLVNEEARRMRK